jgi:hypothetical protein
MIAGMTPSGNGGRRSLNAHFYHRLQGVVVSKRLFSSGSCFYFLSLVFASLPL